MLDNVDMSSEDLNACVKSRLTDHHRPGPC